MEPSSNAKPEPQMKVLALGLPRTGSASIAEALTILGYKNVYHGLRAIDYPQDWEFLGRAADASFSTLPTYTGVDFTLEDWEELYGTCEATTDVAAVFATQLIKVYPNAKVILVIRDYDAWYRSVNESVFGSIWSLPARFINAYVEPIIGSKAGEGVRKIIHGFFEAKNVDEARKNARMVYDRHHREIREMVPPDQLLVYRMGEGWGPICEFLGKPVPDAEFPWVNEAAALKATVARKMRSQCYEASMVLMPWLVGIGAVGAGSWVAVSKLGVSV